MLIQLWKLRLDLENHKLICYRIDADGVRRGKKTYWKILRFSDLPKGLFFHIRNFVQQRLSEAKKRGSGKSRKAVCRGLCEAGERCGCEIKVGFANADLVWMLRGVPLIAFQIHDGELSTTRVFKLESSEAAFRWAVISKENGYFEVKKQKTNRKYRA